MQKTKLGVDQTLLETETAILKDGGVEAESHAVVGGNQVMVALNVRLLHATARQSSQKPARYVSCRSKGHEARSSCWGLNVLIMSTVKNGA